jgi:hypothetical protein
MSGSVTLLDLLTQLAGAELSFRRERDLIAVALLSLPAGRQVLLAELTYRDGIHVLLDPTPEEVETARVGELWELWNSGRFLYLASATGPKGGLFGDDEDEDEEAMESSTST